MTPAPSLVPRPLPTTVVPPSPGESRCLVGWWAKGIFSSRSKIPLEKHQNELDPTRHAPAKAKKPAGAARSAAAPSVVVGAAGKGTIFGAKRWGDFPRHAPSFYRSDHRRREGQSSSVRRGRAQSVSAPAAPVFHVLAWRFDATFEVRGVCSFQRYFIHLSFSS